MRLKRYMVSSKSAKLLVVHLQWGAIFYASWCNFYFMRFGAILCKAIFVIGNDNFPWFKLRKLLTLRRGRSCVGPQVMFDIFLKRLGHYLRAGTRPAPAFGRLGWRVIISLRNLNILFCMVVCGCQEGDNPHPYTGLCCSSGWFLHWIRQVGIAL